MLPYRTVLFDFDYTLGDSSRGIVTSVNAALTALDYPVPEPNPQGIHLARQRLESTPETTLYVGDSVVDALAARQAGFAFAAVLTGTTPAEALQAYQLCTLLRGRSEIVTMIESV